MFHESRCNNALYSNMISFCSAPPLSHRLLRRLSLNSNTHPQRSISPSSHRIPPPCLPFPYSSSILPTSLSLPGWAPVKKPNGWISTLGSYGARSGTSSRRAVGKSRRWWRWGARTSPRRYRSRVRIAGPKRWPWWGRWSSCGDWSPLFLGQLAS